MASPIDKPRPAPRTKISICSSKLSDSEIDFKMKQQIFEFCDSFSNKATKCDCYIKTKIPTQEADLLLIGKTGNGKSAVGNSILGRCAFECKGSLSSVTQNITYDWCVFNDVKLKVVDGPGVADTRLDNEQAIDFVLNAISTAISINSHGYHAFLLVLKYGIRLTAEDQDTIIFLKKVFGEFFFNRFCIIVMTNGDLFEAEEDVTFEEWIAVQDCGIFQQLLKECNNRIVLFDNKTQDEAKKQMQLNDLLKLIEQVKSNNCRYADEHFRSAQDARDALIIEAEKEIISEEITSEVNLIYFKYQEIVNNIETYFRASYLQELSERATALRQKIKEKDKGTHILHSLLMHVQSLINSIVNEITVSTKLAEERDKFELKIKEEALAYEAMLKKQREEFNMVHVHEEDKTKFLKKQLEAMKRKEELWRKEFSDFQAQLKVQSNVERREILALGTELQKLKEMQIEKMKEKRKKGIFSKMKEVLKRR